MNRRNRYRVEFKAKVALSGSRTQAELPVNTKFIPARSATPLDGRPLPGRSPNNSGKTRGLRPDPPPDAADGHRLFISQTSPQQALCGASGVPVYAPGAEYRSAQPGMGNGYHLHSDGQRVHVPGCHHGLGQQKTLGWRLSNTLDSRFCVNALKALLCRYGAPEIFNSDQGGQFTSEAFTGVLKQWQVMISMDGKGRFRGNIFIERLWRALKYERVYLRAYETRTELFKDLTDWSNWYNAGRKHTSLDKQTPDTVDYQAPEPLKLAA